MRLLARDDLRHHRAFAKAFVRQHRRACDVADRIIAGSSRLETLVDLDEPAIGELNTALFEPDVLGVHGAARRHEDRGGDHLFLLATRFDVQRHFVFCYVRLGDLGAGDHVDATLPITLGQRIGRFGVFDRQDARQRLDQGDLHAECLKDVRELHPDCTGADDRERLRNALEQQCFVGRNDGRLIDLEADLRNPFDAGARGDYDGFLCLVDLGADFHLPAGLQDAGALDDCNLVLLHQELDAFRILIAHAPRTLHRDAVIGFDIGDLHPKLFRFFENRREIRRMEKRFGRNATDVHAHAAQFFLFDDCRAHPELGAANGADVARGAAA